MKHRRLIAALASLALNFNASGIAMAMSPAGTESSPLTSIDASDAAHCAGVADDSPSRGHNGCGEYDQCACVPHATMGAMAVVAPVLPDAEGPSRGSAGIAASPPVEDPLRPPIA